VLRELGQTGDGELLPLEALTAIHWMHRAGALVVLLYCTLLGLRLARYPSTRGAALALVLTVWLQASLGVLNVLFSLPLPLAAAHNAGAALLLLAVIVINFKVVHAAPRGDVVPPGPASRLRDGAPAPHPARIGEARG